MISCSHLTILIQCLRTTATSEVWAQIQTLIGFFQSEGHSSCSVTQSSRCNLLECDAMSCNVNVSVMQSHKAKLSHGVFAMQGEKTFHMHCNKLQVRVTNLGEAVQQELLHGAPHGSAPGE